MKRFISSNSSKGSRIRRLPGFIILVAGLILLLLPLFSGTSALIRDQRETAGYQKKTESLDRPSADQQWEEARAYNRAHPYNRIGESQESEDEAYDRALDLSGDGIMGILTIPRIHVTLPVGHRCVSKTLDKRAGHMMGTSLPVGGKGTHAVIAGHRGLPSARLFTDLDRLEEGDRFSFSVLGRTLTYQVDQILTVAPDDTRALETVAGKDYMTLVTCTPYGLNTHRLLVRGRRIRTPEKAEGKASHISFWTMLATLIHGWLFRDGAWKYLLLIICSVLVIMVLTKKRRNRA